MRSGKPFLWAFICRLQLQLRAFTYKKTGPRRFSIKESCLIQEINTASLLYFIFPDDSMEIGASMFFT